MSKFRLLSFISLLFATATLANTRDWKPAVVINLTETDVTSEFRIPKNTMHYTIETDQMVYFADYAYKPTQQSRDSVPEIAVNVPIKIAVEGRSAYVLDVTGREVKLHIVKKAIKK
jgi:hypothetical protein